MDANTQPQDPSTNGRLGPYSAAYTATRASIAARARAAADLATNPVEAIENLELLRAVLHREVDHLLDAEAGHRRRLPLVPAPRDGSRS